MYSPFSLSASFDNRNKYFEFVNVGYWTPLLGFITQELAFPHITHYFRNITLDIITTHVRLHLYNTMTIKKRNLFRIRHGKFWKGIIRVP